MYSSVVIKASTLTITPFQYNASRASPTDTLPGLPQSWLAAHQASVDGSTEEEEDGPTTPEPQAEFDGSTIKGPKRGRAGGESFMSGMTDSTVGAVVGHGHQRFSTDSSSSSDDQTPGDGFDNLATLAASQQFFTARSATLSALRRAPTEVIPVPAHRFSLIKPTFQRFLGSLPDMASQTKRGSVDGKRASVEGAPATSPVRTDAGPGAGADNKCALCDRKLGFLKAYLECDDCHLRCHLKCSDSCQVGCEGLAAEVGAGLTLVVSADGGRAEAGSSAVHPLTKTKTAPAMPTRKAPPPPAGHGPSKLLKKRPAVAA